VRIPWLLGVALCLSVGEAGAADPDPVASVAEQGANANTAYLSYSPPEEQCIAAEELVAAVRAHIGRNPFVAEPAGVVIDVRLERVGQPARWHAVLHVGDGRSQTWGEREVLSENDDCRTLDSPLTLILALVVDSELMQPPPAPGEQAPVPTPSPKPEESRFEEEPAPPLKPSRPPPPWEAEIDGVALTETGVLPHLALGAELAALVRPPYVPDFRVHVAGFLPQEQELAGGNSALRFAHARAGLQLCAKLAAWSALRFDACSGVSAGLIKAKGKGLTPERSVTRSLFESALTVRGALDLTSLWSVVMVGDLLFPWQTDRFVYASAGGPTSEAHEVSPFVVDLGVGVALRFR
jgi:hypothetical protein